MSDTTTSEKVTVGLDLGDRFIQVCVLDEGGEVVEEARLAARADALRRRFAAEPPVRIVLEAGTHSPWVSRLLSECGHEVIVANPRKLRLICQNDSKSDRVDAEYLARVGRLDRGRSSPHLRKPGVRRQGPSSSTRHCRPLRADPSAGYRDRASGEGTLPGVRAPHPPGRLRFAWEGAVSHGLSEGSERQEPLHTPRAPQRGKGDIPQRQDHKTIGPGGGDCCARSLGETTGSAMAEGRPADSHDQFGIRTASPKTVSMCPRKRHRKPCSPQCTARQRPPNSPPASIRSLQSTALVTPKKGYGLCGSQDRPLAHSPTRRAR